MPNEYEHDPQDKPKHNGSPCGCAVWWAVEYKDEYGWHVALQEHEEAVAPAFCASEKDAKKLMAECSKELNMPKESLRTQMFIRFAGSVN